MVEIMIGAKTNVGMVIVGQTLALRGLNITKECPLSMGYEVIM
ncbi:MAG: hypothetical protein QXT63_03035 [Thermoplasmata archaeon]